MSKDKSVYNKRTWLSENYHSTASVCCWYNLDTLKHTLRAYFTIKDCHNTFMMPIELDDSGKPTELGKYIIENVLEKLIHAITYHLEYDFCFEFNDRHYVVTLMNSGKEVYDCSLEIRRYDVVKNGEDWDLAPGDGVLRLRLHGDKETCPFSEYSSKLNLLRDELNEFRIFLSKL